MRQPLADVAALQRHLSGEARRRHASPEDPGRLRSADLEVLQSVHELGPLGPFASFRNRRSIARLEREGFLTLDGALDEAGEEFMRPIAEAEDVLALRGQVGGERTLFQSWLAGRDVATVSGAPGPDLLAGVGLAGGGSGHRTYAVTHAERGALPSQVCAWAGVRTHPPAMIGQLLVPEAEFTARAADPLRPPPAAVFGADGDALAALWAEPWFVWEVTSSALGVNLAFINAQGAGNYVFGGDRAASEEAGELMVRIAPVTAQAVWETLWVLSHRGGQAGAQGSAVLGVAQDGRQSLQVPDLPASW
ncbi:MAG: hypothetical protein QJR09_03210 [Micrococcus sp.]|nr:hypothetical protein [Micrococcus sp.]